MYTPVFRVLRHDLEGSQDLYESLRISLTGHRTFAPVDQRFNQLRVAHEQRGARLNSTHSGDSPRATPHHRRVRPMRLESAQTHFQSRSRQRRLLTSPPPPPPGSAAPSKLSRAEQPMAIISGDVLWLSITEMTVLTPPTFKSSA